MVKYLTVFFVLSPSILFAGQTTAQYKRNLMMFCYEEFGSTFTDVSTHTFATKLVGSGQAVISGKDGLALSLSAGGFQLPDATLRAPDTSLRDMTAMFVFRPTGGASGTSCLFCHNGSASGANLAGFQAHRLYWNWSPSGIGNCTDVVDPLTSNAPVSSATWHQIIFTRLDNQRKEIWLDGVMVSSAATLDCTDTADTVMEIGSNSGGANNNVKGDLAEAVLWRAYFTPGEIKYLYQQFTGKPKRFLNSSIPQ